MAGLSQKIVINQNGCGTFSVCCALLHESQHIKQHQMLCALCKKDPGGRSFSDCMKCYGQACKARTEVAGYHAACQVATACGPGGNGSGGSPPSDFSWDAASDPGLQCFGEWLHCRAMLEGSAPLPAACGGNPPACNAIVNNADVQCNCGTHADQKYGCKLACANGTCGPSYDSDGGNRCKCNNPSGKCKTLWQNEVPCHGDSVCTSRKMEKGPCKFDRLGNCSGSELASCYFASDYTCKGVSVTCALEPASADSGADAGAASDAAADSAPPPPPPPPPSSEGGL